MSAVGIVAAILGGLLGASLLWYAAIRLWYRFPDGVDETHHVHTADGFRIALSRYLPRAEPQRHPVLLCPGLAGNRFSFDLGDDHALAPWLASRGFDVWCLELRDHGKSRRRPWDWLRRPGWGWTLDDHLEHDVAGALALVCERTGAASAHFVGHSVGGILVYGHLARGGDRVRSAVAIGSSLDYSSSKSWFHRVTGLTWLRYVVPAVHMGFVSTITAPFSARGPSKLDEFNFWRPNIRPERWRRLAAVGFHSVSARVMLQLASAFAPGGLRNASGRQRYFDALSDVRTPVLAVAGTRDRQCPPDAACRTLEALGTDDRKLAVFGPDHGHVEHYGHVDLVVGRRVEREVYPVVHAWLADHDHPLEREDAHERSETG